MSIETVTDFFGIRRKLGCNPSDSALVESVGGWPEGTNPLIKRERWKKLSFFDWPQSIAIKDQGATGSCNGHAAASCIEYGRYVSGMTHKRLSPWFIYAILCKGIDAGSNILDSLRLASELGVSPDEDVPGGTINPRAINKKAYDEAKRFRIEIGSRLTTWDEIVTATILRRPMNLSIRVGRDFSYVDNDGVPPVSPGAANHAVCCAGGFKIARNGKPSVLCANSWGSKWGSSGFFWITEDHIVAAKYFECFTVVAVKDDPIDKNAIPSF